MRKTAVRMVMLAGAALLALPGVAGAQEQEASEEAKQFFRLMADQFKPGPARQALPMTSNRIHSGYYRLVVKRTGTTDPALLQGACKAALESTGGNDAVKNLIFRRESDAGVTLQLPLVTSLSAADTPASYAQLNLFRIFRTGGGKCKVALSYFDQHDAYFGPLVRIDQSLTADPQRAQLEIKPWVSIKANRNRLDGLWNLASKAIPLLGPIGAIIGGGKNEDGSDADKYQLKSELKDTLFGAAGQVQTPSDLTRYKEIIVNPTSGATHAAGSYAFDWALNWDDDGAKSYRFGYSIDLDYRGSLLFPGQTYPNLARYGRDDFARLATSQVPSVLAGSNPVAWVKLDSAIENLALQTNEATFAAACWPAFDSLNGKGLSFEDQVLLVYTIARGVSGLTPQMIGRLPCLTKNRLGSAENPRGGEALARFGIKLEKAAPQLPDTGAGEWGAVRDAMFKALQAPRYLGNYEDPAAFERNVAQRILLGGDTGFFSDPASRQPNAPVQSGPVELTRERFVEGFKRLPITSRTGCGIPREAAPAGEVFRQFPSGTGMPDAPDRILGLLALRGQSDVWLVLMGLNGKDQDGNAVIGSLWAGKQWDDSDPALKSARDAMRAFEACSAKLPAFRSFINGPAQGQDNAAPANNGGQGGASPDPVLNGG